MGRRSMTVLVAAALLAVVPGLPAQARTNPLGQSSGQIVARGCTMGYSLTPVAGDLEVAGSISCPDSPRWYEMSVTLLDNGLVIDDERLAGDPGCDFQLGGKAVGCRFPVERGHLYSAVFDFYMEDVGSQLAPYPNDPLNGGTCSSSPFTRSEFNQLECEAALHYLAL